MVQIERGFAVLLLDELINSFNDDFLELLSIGLIVNHVVKRFLHLIAVFGEFGGKLLDRIGVAERLFIEGGAKHFQIIAQ